MKNKLRKILTLGAVCMMFTVMAVPVCAAGDYNAQGYNFDDITEGQALQPGYTILATDDNVNFTVTTADGEYLESGGADQGTEAVDGKGNSFYYFNKTQPYKIPELGYNYTVESKTTMQLTDNNLQIYEICLNATAIQYTIRYHDGKTLIGEKNVTVEAIKSEKPTFAAAPTKDGYDFVCWSTEVGNDNIRPGDFIRDTFLLAIGKSANHYTINLYAKWEPATAAKVPKTGDNLPIGMLLTLMTVSAVTLVACRRRSA